MLLAIVVVLMVASTSHAAHIIGGDITYVCTGPGSTTGTMNYEFSMVVYRDCSRDGEPGVANFFDNPAVIGIHRQLSSGNYEHVQTQNIRVRSEAFVMPDDSNPCIILPPNLCVRRAEYSWTITDLPVIDEQYMVSYQRCCRNNTVQNIEAPGDQGAAFFTIITPQSQRDCNASPVFNDFPPIVICANFPFTYDHSAVDDDGDMLIYTFCDIQSAGSSTDFTCGTVPDPVQCLPPFRDINFRDPLYTAQRPITGDPLLEIDSLTGEITGTPNLIGQFVVGICVEEWRGGVLIGTTKRDFQFNVALCEPTIDAIIEGESAGDDLFVVTSCGERSVSLRNQSVQERFIVDYFWLLNYPDGSVRTWTTADVDVEFPGPGSYSGIMAINRGTDCADTADVTIVVTEPMTPDFEISGDSCEDTTLRFLDRSFSPDNTIDIIAWDFGDGTRDTGDIVMHSYDVPGRYTIELEITDTAGCQEQVFQSVDYFPVPQTLLASEDASEGCLPVRIGFRNLSTPIDDSYTTTWIFGDGATAEGTEVQHFYTEPGRYIVLMIVESPIGCIDTLVLDQPIDIAAPPEVDFVLSYDSCRAGPIEFDGEVIFDSGSGSIAWDFGTGGAGSTLEDPTFLYDEPGRYMVTIVAEDASGCSTTLEREINYFPIPVMIEAAVDTFFGCPPFRVTFDNLTEPLSPDYLIEWDFGDGETGTGDLTSHIYQDAGDYEISLRITSPIGCVDSAVLPAAIEIAPAPVAAYDVTSDPCDGTALTLQNQSTADVPIVSYEWNLGDGTRSGAVDIDHVYPSPGIYELSLVITDERSCRDTVGEIYRWFPSPSEEALDLSLTEGCTPLPVRLINASQPLDSSYLVLWDLGDGTRDTGLVVDHIYTTPGVYDISFDIISPDGCESSASFQKQIRVEAPPVAAYTTDPAEPNKNEPDVTFINLSTSATNYEWYVDSALISMSEGAFFAFPAVDTFFITLVASNDVGCVDTLMSPLRVAPAVNIYIPNVFSPNGDGVNDVLLPFLNCPVLDYDFSIYDRWGSRVYQSQDMTAGWAGNFQESTAPIAVYTYVISYRLEASGELLHTAGDVTLIR